jgi:Ca2+-binding RTX toxin-like protein
MPWLCACALLLVLPSMANAALPQVTVRVAQYPDQGTSPERLAITGQNGTNEDIAVAFDEGTSTVTVTSPNITSNPDVDGDCGVPVGDTVTCDITTVPDHTICVDGYGGDDTISFTGLADYPTTPAGVGAYTVELIGGIGNDNITGGAGREYIWGDLGGDLSGAPTEAECREPTFTIVGTDPQDDTISDGLGYDQVRGEGGDDTVLQPALGGTAAFHDEDDIDLGAGSDTVTYAARSASDPVSVQLGTDGVSSATNDGDLLGDSIEQVIGGAGADTFENQLAIAGATFDGGPGDDTVLASDFNETFIGGPGTDTMDYAGATDRSWTYDGVDVSPDGVANDGDPDLLEADDVMPDVEQIVGTPVADHLTGAAAASCWLQGGGGDDVLTASASGCILQGDAGADQLVGGSGNDTLRPGLSGGTSVATADVLTFGAGVDTVDYAASGFNGVEASAAPSAVPWCSGLGVGTGPTNKSALKGGGTPGIDQYTDAPEHLIGTVGSDTLCGGSGDTTLEGGAGTDTLIGGAGNDTIVGGTGNDGALFGQSGNDVITGGDGDDNNIKGGAGSDDVDGGDGNDVVRGGGGSDTIRGGAGDDHLDETTFSSIEIGQPGIELDAADHLDGGPGADVLDGATGDDTFTCSDDLLTDNVSDSGGGTETIDCSGLGHAISYAAGSGIDRIIGTGGNDTLAGAPVLDGGPGNDTLNAVSGGTANGGDGDDVLQAGSGGSTLNGDGGNDTLRGEAGADALHGGSGNDTIVGGAGDDQVDGGSGSDFLSGGPGTEAIDFSASSAGVNVSLDGIANDGPDNDNYEADFEQIIGGSGADRFVAGATGITILGGAGNDRLVGGAGADVIDAGLGNDTVFGGPGRNALAGGAGNDHVTGGSGAERLYGGSGVDVLDGGTGADRLSGGPSVDTVTYRLRRRPVNVTIGAGRANDGEARERDDVLIDVEFVTGGRSNDRLTGSRFANTLRGGAGRDVINGGAGRDRLYGDSGNDTLVSRDRRARDRRAREIVDGGSGRDSARIDRADRRIRVERLLR